MNSSEILAFWFEEIEPSTWWAKDLAFDQLIVDRFTHVHKAAMQCELHDWRSTAQGRLAEIIVLDQFSRNMYRDTPLAFAADSLALVLSQEAISRGVDKELTQSQRNFLYMPHMHSESLKIHQLAIALYTENGDQFSLDFEIKHRDIIQEFGRYPHRNAILGRSSTQSERAFLTQENSSF